MEKCRHRHAFEKRGRPAATGSHEGEQGGSRNGPHLQCPHPGMQRAGWWLGGLSGQNLPELVPGLVPHHGGFGGSPTPPPPVLAGSCVRWNLLPSEMAHSATCSTYLKKQEAEETETERSEREQRGSEASTIKCSEVWLRWSTCGCSQRSLGNSRSGHGGGSEQPPWSYSNHSRVLAAPA